MVVWVVAMGKRSKGGGKGKKKGKDSGAEGG